MRIIIGIPDGQAQDLTDLAARLKQARAALVRQAITEYLARHRRNSRVDAFGLWGADAPDGVTYQHRIRGAW
ncbi:MAG TPA: CopG family transcriptional regulator [Acetobacteraceae bacterium]|nr:CopG family transcriptional regulator [Acetobacteraceae bacterium]